MIYLGLGSNVGDRTKFLANAVEKLAVLGTVAAQSRVYETDPWGNTDQAAFLNQCVALDTKLDPTRLIGVVKNLEHQLGRTETTKWGPREIDIDILFADDTILKSAELTLPHPFVHERAFVLAPLNEIAPDFIHPEQHKMISELLDEVDTSGVRVFI